MCGDEDDKEQGTIKEREGVGGRGEMIKGHGHTKHPAAKNCAC